MNLSELSQSQLGTLGNMIMAAEEEVWKWLAGPRP